MLEHKNTKFNKIYNIIKKVNILLFGKFSKAQLQYYAQMRIARHLRASTKTHFQHCKFLLIVTAPLDHFFAISI